MSRAASAVPEPWRLDSAPVSRCSVGLTLTAHLQGHGRRDNGARLFPVTCSWLGSPRVPEWFGDLCSSPSRSTSQYQSREAVGPSPGAISAPVWRHDSRGPRCQHPRKRHQHQRARHRDDDDHDDDFRVVEALAGDDERGRDVPL